MTNHRKPVPDLMKGLAVVAMIQVHIMELFARQEILSGTLGKISLFIGGPFAAPVFMAVMGYFLAASKKSIGVKVKRGILLILLGLLLNIGLNLHLLIKIFNGSFKLNPLEYVFGADILFLAGFSIIFISIAEKIFRNRLYPAIAISILIPLVSPFLPDLPSNLKYIQAFLYGHASWSYFPVIPWLAYPLLGYGFGMLETGYPAAWKWIDQKKHIILIISVLIIVAVCIQAFKIITSLPDYYHHGIFLFAWLVAFLITWTWLLQKLEAVAGKSPFMKFIKWIGRNVTVVYVIQWLIIGNIATAIYRSQEAWTLGPWFLAITTITAIIGYLYERFISAKLSSHFA